MFSDTLCAIQSGNEYAVSALGSREAILLQDKTTNDFATAVLQPSPFDEQTWLADTFEHVTNRIEGQQCDSLTACHAAGHASQSGGHAWVNALTNTVTGKTARVAVFAVKHESCSKPCAISKYAPQFYRPAVRAIHSGVVQVSNKAKLLEQQTVAMQLEWQQQEAAAHSCNYSPLKYTRCSNV